MRTLNNWTQYNEKKNEESSDFIEIKKKKEPKEELTSHDKMWNGVGENLKGIISIIKDKDSEEIVSMLKNKIADGKLKFKDIRAIKKTAKALNVLMK